MSQDALDDPVNSPAEEASGLFEDRDAFRSSVIAIVATWVIKNVFVEPTAWVIGIIDWGVASALGGVEEAVKHTFGISGATIRGAYLGPGGVVTVIRNTAVETAASAGLAAPIAAGIVNLLLVTLVVGLVYLLARAVAGYLTGGVLS